MSKNMPKEKLTHNDRGYHQLIQGLRETYAVYFGRPEEAREYFAVFAEPILTDTIETDIENGYYGDRVKVMFLRAQQAIGKVLEEEQSRFLKTHANLLE